MRLRCVCSGLTAWANIYGEERGACASLQTRLHCVHILPAGATEQPGALGRRSVPPKGTFTYDVRTGGLAQKQTILFIGCVIVTATGREGGNSKDFPDVICESSPICLLARRL